VHTGKRLVAGYWCCLARALIYLVRMVGPLCIVGRALVYLVRMVGPLCIAGRGYGIPCEGGWPLGIPIPLDPV